MSDEHHVKNTAA